jgi:hypothetical protein
VGPFLLTRSMRRYSQAERYSIVKSKLPPFDHSSFTIIIKFSKLSGIFKWVPINPSVIEEMQNIDERIGSISENVNLFRSNDNEVTSVVN